MLKDKEVIKVKAGNGGKGSYATFQTRAIGGDGGKGGDVMVEGDENVYDLSWFIPNKTYKAENGKHGNKNNRRGADGKDLVLKVPLVTEVFIEDQKVAVIKNHKQQYKLADGGVGGLGNKSLARNRNIDPRDDLMEGESKKMKLIFKIKSDVIFLGFPNAGKSTMLNELTKAKVKTAAYEFTTLEPQIGLMDGIRLLDLPGLIEGTHEGKGLGTDFVKHTEYAKVIAHFVSLESDDPFRRYELMRKEIEEIGSGLDEKEELVVLTKSDEAEKERITEVEKVFKDKGVPVVSCSIIDDESMENVRDTVISLLE